MASAAGPLWSAFMSCMLTASSDPLNAPPFAVVSDARLVKELSLPAAPSVVVVSYVGGVRQYQGTFDKEGLYNWTVNIRAEEKVSGIEG